MCEMLIYVFMETQEADAGGKDISRARLRRDSSCVSIPPNR